MASSPLSLFRRGNSQASMELPEITEATEEKQSEPVSPTGSEADFGSLEEQARLFLGRDALGRERDLPAFRFQLEHTLQHSSPSEKAKAAKYLALLCRMEASKSQKKEELLQKAKEYFEEGFKACKTDEKLIFDFLEFLQREGEFSRAFQVCSEAIEQNKLLNHLFCIRARIGALLGEYSVALADSLAFLHSPSQVFVKKRTDQIEMHDLAADCLIIENRYSEACEHLEKAWRLEFNAEARAERSQKLLKVRLKDRSCFLKELSEKFHKKKVDVAIALSKKSWKESLQMVEEAIGDGKLDSFSLAKALALRAIIYTAKGDVTSARGDIEQLEQKIVPQVPESDRAEATRDLCHAQATVYLKEGKRKEALETFRRGWQQEKKTRSFALDYLTALKSEKNDEEALRVCNEAQELLGEEGFLLAQLEVYFAEGQWDLVRKTCAERLKKSMGWASQIKVCDLAATACKNLDPPPLVEIYSYLKEAYLLDRTPNFIRRYEELIKIHEELAKTQVSALLALPQKDRKMILEIAKDLVEDDPHGALEVLEQTSSDHWEVLLSRADAHMKLGNLVSARRDVELAWRLVHPPQRWGFLFRSSSLDREETAVFASFAKLCIYEGKPKVALQYFKKGLDAGRPNALFISYYFHFLIDSEKNFEEASRLLYGRNVSLSVFSQWKIKLDLACKGWDRIITIIESYRGLYPSLELLDAAVAAYLKKDCYRQAQEKAIQAFEKETNSYHIPSRIEKIEEIFRQRLTHKHFEDLIEDAKKNEKMTAEQKIIYVKKLLEIYREELDASYGSCKARLLQCRGHESVQVRRFQEAFDDFSAAYELYRKDPDRWQRELHWLKRVIKEAKCRCPKAPPYQKS